MAQTTNKQLQGTNYDLDLETQELIFIRDQDTREMQHIPLSEVVEMLGFLMRHGDDLRALIYKQTPVDFRKPMILRNGYYVGCTRDRKPVKVSAENWQRIMAQHERVIRQEWVLAQKESNPAFKTQWSNVPMEVEIFDTAGNLIPNPAKKGVLDNEKVVPGPEDCPDWVLQERLYPLKQVEYWVDRHENLLLGSYLKWY